MTTTTTVEVKGQHASQQWYDLPLRDREYDVVVKFRVTADDFPAAVALVDKIVTTDMFERHIVPMYVPDQAGAG